MRYILSLVFIGLSFYMSSQQQQQQMGNVYLANYMNPVVQVAQTSASSNVLINTDDNFGNEQSQQGNFNDNNSNIQYQSMNNVNQAGHSNKGIDFSFSLNISSRSSSASGSSSSSKLNKHTFAKKFNKFERNMYGKLGSHKKSKRLVDVCFHWS